MAPQPVEAVFVVFYGLTAHKATYGRDVVGDTTYTKDYIQLIQEPEFREALERLFPRSPGAKGTQIEYRWPGGSSGGQVIFESKDRPHLAWLKTVGAPAPWKMADNPDDTGPETIPGDPTRTDPASATAQFNALVSNGIQPYLVAVKLRGETNVLHVRAYIADPPAGLEFADLDLLPAPVRALAEKTSSSRAFKWALFDSSSAVMSPEVSAIVERLEDNPCLLLSGPPGTGKTALLNSLVDFVENPGRGVQFDPDENHDAWSEISGAVPGMSRTVVMHPSYSYDNLMVGLLPEPAPGGGVGVKVATGPLVNLAHYASAGGNRALLVLDEFNRANAAAVLGDALALLDKDKRGLAHIDLPYGELGIEVPAEFAANGSRDVAPRFTLPPNLWIVAAMNTSDRSVAPLDAALRRRFPTKRMWPDYEALAQHLGADPDADLAQDLHDWTSGHVGKLAVALMRSINARIDAVMGADFQLGPSNVWHIGGESVPAQLLSLAAAFDGSIVDSLKMSLQDDDGALGAILLAGTPDAPLGGRKVAARWHRPDPSLGSFASDRIQLREVAALSPESGLAELKRQAGV